MENIKEIIAKNLVDLRKSKKYTQQELADKLNYSDKAVSRWEHAETLPDIETLCRICDIYGVHFEYLLQKEQPKKNNPYIKKSDLFSRIIVTLIGAISVWIAAVVGYIYFESFLSVQAWTIFIWAIPVTTLLCSFFNRLFFGSTVLKYILSSVTLWTLLLSFYLQTISANVWLLFVLGIPIQLIIVLLAMLKAKKRL